MASRRTAGQHGFSLIELTVACVVVGIAVAVSIPNLRSYRESHRIWRASEQVSSACRSARARARSRNHNIIIDYRPSQDEFAIIEDENNNNIADAGETVTVYPLPDGLNLQATTFPGNQLIFDRRGRAVSNGQVQLLGGSGVQGKTVRVSEGTGQVTVISGSGP